MIERLLAAGPRHRVRVRCTDRTDGDFRIDGPAAALAARRAALAPGEWTWLHQVHGNRVVEVRAPGDGAGSEADAGVTNVPGAVLAVQTADCAPVVLVAPGAVAAVHAGWRGIVDGVIPAAVAALTRLGDAPVVTALLGPCIGPSSYEFGADDLEAVVAVVGEAARSTTQRGTPALDLGAAVEAQCRACGVASFDRIPADTADPRWFSHRARGDVGRQTTVAWLETV